MSSPQTLRHIVSGETSGTLQLLHGSLTGKDIIINFTETSLSFSIDIFILY